MHFSRSAPERSTARNDRRDLESSIPRNLPNVIAWTLGAVLFVMSVALGVGPAFAREWMDATGKFRVDAELVAVRGNNVILERADGKIITIPLDRLCAADRDFLKTQGSTPPGPSSPKAAPGDIPGPDRGKEATGQGRVANKDDLPLVEKTEHVLRTHCYRCHGEDGASEGGFNFVVNLEKLSRTLAKPGDLKNSRLWERIKATDDSVMPPRGESSRPSDAELEVVKAWIEAGAPSRPISVSRPFVTNEQIVDMILKDVRAQGERSRRFMRYFTLTHLFNAGVSEDELQTYRNAFTKLINSLSWNTDLVIPRAIDEAKTVFGIDMRDLHWNGDIWHSIEEANPYFLRLTTSSALACYQETQTEMPYVRIDWFVFAASQPPLYHSVLNLPQSDADLEDMLRINVSANIEQEQAIRAGFNRSGVSQHNRLIEWHKSPYGSYWKSYDFGGSVGHQNLFQYPLGPSRERESFQHDGGEIIFSLPNGLQGYLLVDNSGKRIDQGPTSIVSDPKRPDKTVTNGVSCMSCHYTGVIPKRDEVGVAVRANRAAFADADDILAIYREPQELDRIMDRDSKRFAEVSRKIGISSLSRSGEPVSAMAARFDQEVDLPQVACEFGLSVAEFEKRLDKATTVARAFSSLRVPGGTMKRDALKTMFGEASVELKLVTEAREARPAPALASAGTSRSSPSRTSKGSRVDRQTPGNDQSYELARFNDLTWGVKSLAFSPDGKLLAAGKPDQALWLFSATDKSKLGEFNKLESLQQVSACAFARNGTTLLAAGHSGQITVFSVSAEGRLKELSQFAGHSQEVTCLSISADGKYALSGGQEKKARYWEIQTGREIAAISGFQGPVKALQFVRNGRSALVSDGATFIEYDLTKRDVRRQRPLNRSMALAAAISPDGEWVAASDSTNIRVWNASTGQELPPLAGNEIQWSMVFTADGSRLLSGARGRVNVWDVRKGQRLFSLATATPGYVQSLAISADGRMFAAAGAPSGELQIFQVPKK